jgi:polar amino acid transport system substrate-binding protein
VPQDFPPFGSVGPDMKPRGLDIDTAKLLADQLKVKLELTPVNSTNRIPFLTTGKVDLVISSLGKNPEREKVIDFSRPTRRSTWPCSARRRRVTSLDDLKGKTISVTRGAIEDIELTKVAPEGVTIKRFEDNNSTIAAYLAGQVDLIASGNVVMVAISERKPETRAGESEAQGFAGLRRREQERAGAAGQGQPDPRHRQGDGAWKRTP